MVVGQAEVMAVSSVDRVAIFRESVHKWELVQENFELKGKIN